ncbi:PEP-CTERM protein-sorting domain-containing protein [Rubritalea squalenifaciens DSM 18772]|uniref:PEP-CTERM protein-sorting domain-containing protein n=1 Tax=Rubritalea squalenifaciens DSM 18772 TaxID=1123071 RepID=A0A1M6M1H1_9BACT|nr:PEP-CTERM sorting domain-containing protein [Rubritalea squalenifaciens]SHJ77285.1 PEP-CTERM protein-sorting domain-containing protein [Rubritalea squalenifaciens DSM 18772]
MKTLALISLLGSLGVANAATTYLDIDFDDLADGSITTGATITNNGTGPNGTWDGGTSSVSSGTVDTIANDGYINFASGIGLSMDLSTHSYTFTATVDPDGTQTRGLFGQINSLTSDNSEFWIRLTSTNDVQFLFRDASGNQIVAAHETTSLLDAAGYHTISLVIDNNNVTTFVDGNQIAQTSSTILTDTIGTANDRFIAHAYNTTPGNRFDGLADSYLITSSVPEPSSTALLGLAGCVVLLRRRR